MQVLQVGVCVCVCLCVCVCVCVYARARNHAPDVLPCWACTQLLVLQWQAKQLCWRDNATMSHRLKVEGSPDISF